MLNEPKYNLTEIFQKAKYEPDSNLAPVIWRKIIARDKYRTQIKMWAFAFAGSTSLLGLIWAVKTLFTNLAQSGFYEYFSLIFSDSGVLVSFWKELVFSLAETLPIVSITLTLCLLFVCFLSLRHLMKQVGKNQLSLSIPM
ncbi:MAG: hypothetical protein WAN61_02725 [Minisyncoccia bacterium]